MAVEYIFGDLFDHFIDNTILVHGCNTQHVMGSGVALQVKQKYPAAYYEYMSRPVLTLGDVIFVCVDESRNMWIANAITQEFFGRDGKVYADLTAIESTLTRVKEFYKFTIIMPEIGCGLGGLTTEKVFPIINNVFNEKQICKVITWKS